MAREISRRNSNRSDDEPGTELSGMNGEADDFRSDPTGLGVQTRSEIDTQIATAKKYPRSPALFMREAMAMVSLDVDIAGSCTYSLQRRDREGKLKLITGPSVRLAEIIASCWGNLRIAGRIIGDDGRAVVAQGVSLDCEKNLGYSMEVRRGILRSDGRRYSEDMITTTANAAIAIVTRNVTLKAVPRALVDTIHKHAKTIAKGDIKTLPERATKALRYFAKRGVPEEMVYAALDVQGVPDMTLDDLVILQGMRTALEDGVTTVEELFPRPTPPASGSTPEPSSRETVADATLRRLKGQAPPHAPPEEHARGSQRPAETDDDEADPPRADELLPRAAEAPEDEEQLSPDQNVRDTPGRDDEQGEPKGQPVPPSTLLEEPEPFHPMSASDPDRKPPAKRPTKAQQAKAAQAGIDAGSPFRADPPVSRPKPVPDPEDMPEDVPKRATPPPMPPPSATPPATRPRTAAEERLLNRKAAEQGPQGAYGRRSPLVGEE